ncbi:unnamed protein product [Linum trigynum]|uniref:Uncharacterized protein n=1 Tax=Linum trigynum TaxID=586398 RepID=A0AAV2GKU1_9ROSI
MLPTFSTGTISLNTLCPGHPGHFVASGCATVDADAASYSGASPPVSIPCFASGRWEEDEKNRKKTDELWCGWI